MRVSTRAPIHLYRVCVWARRKREVPAHNLYTLHICVDTTPKSPAATSRNDVWRRTIRALTPTLAENCTRRASWNSIRRPTPAQFQSVSNACTQTYDDNGITNHKVHTIYMLLHAEHRVTQNATADYLWQVITHTERVQCVVALSHTSLDDYARAVLNLTVNRRRA